MHSFTTTSVFQRVQSIDTLHISIMVVNDVLGGTGPLRADFHRDSGFKDWFFKLALFQCFRLRQATVIISDDLYSKFGLGGYENRTTQREWNGVHDSWLALREQQCLSAQEKRKWARRLEDAPMGKELIDMDIDLVVVAAMPRYEGATQIDSPPDHWLYTPHKSFLSLMS
ncbi:hypothetical protein P154DRAFT_17145 [Amniculicola lignicola CBS 123094]|uniref:Uncharacterized protein n=1 Tax=Amniculicola lignicola CBS 123094 TaxID=1392246 RepID=A0A6A5X5K3_9PLEO|nr:hypothetical protein P154DRAFT_17145 [Amniculicola lignicola CBS 123094]